MCECEEGPTDTAEAGHRTSSTLSHSQVFGELYTVYTSTTYEHSYINSVILSIAV